MPLATIPEAIADFEEGKFVIIVDDEDRENEGDLCVAAQLVTPDQIAFMAKKASGLICTPIVASRLDELGIEPAVVNNTSRYGTAFSVSVEARDLVSTGISAPDRAATIRHLLDPAAKPTDFAKPGHTFPLRAAEGGVLKRAGQTEAAVDLAALAGLYPAGVICEIMNEDGTMARMPDLERFSRQHGIRLITVADLIGYRMRTESLVHRVAQPSLPTVTGDFRLIAYRSRIGKKTHLALLLGAIKPDDTLMVRVHSECITGDVFGSLRCDCGSQLRRGKLGKAA